MVQSIGQILDERGSRYGQFINQAGIAQGFHQVMEFGMQITGKNRFDFTVDELEAINMIFNKIARIVNGDPHYSDSWRDIAGYATLVADRLDNDNREQKLIEANTNDGAGNAADVEPDRGGYEESQPVQQNTREESYSDSRPTGLTELRRMPVDDGETTKAYPRLRDIHRQ